MIRGVLFDLFHTLTSRESEWGGTPTCDLVGVTRREWDQVLVDHADWRYRGDVKDGYETLKRMLAHAKPHYDEGRVRDIFDKRQARFRGLFQRLPEENVAVVRTLKARGIKVALVSNADAMDVECYDGCALHGLFDVEVFSCEVGFQKPEPRIYSHVLESLGLPASDCAFVGDGGSRELEGARAAGLTTVLISGVIEELWPERIPDLEKFADHHVRALPEVLELFPAPMRGTA